MAVSSADKNKSEANPPPVAIGAVRAARPPRAMHATIIGVAAPANPPPLAVPPPAPDPTAENPTADKPADKLGTDASGPSGGEAGPAIPIAPAAAARRNPKRTMIGGLEAAPGSAPLPQAVGLGIPSETKWTVLLANSGAAVMSAPEIVRAYVEGRVLPDAKLWREGLDGWKTLSDIEPIRVAFERAGLNPKSPAPRSEKGTASDSSADGDLPSSTRERADQSAPGEPASKPGRPPADTDVHGPTWLGTDDDAQEPITRVAHSPRVDESAAARVDASRPPSELDIAGLRTAKMPSQAAPFGPSDSDLEEPAHPKSRPDIGPRDTVRGELHPVSSLPPRAPGAAIGGQPGLGHASSGVNAGGVGLAGREASVGSAAISGVAAGDGDGDGDGDRTATTERPQKRRRGRRRGIGLLVWTLVVLSLVTATTVSYRSKSPRALYGYLHQKRWDVPLDRTVQKYVASPYRAVAKKVAGIFEKPKGKR